MKKILKINKWKLLLIAGIVWILAGLNVFKIGIKSYEEIKISSLYIFFSFLIFVIFSLMFYKISKKHLERIKSYKEKKKEFWHFFDKKSYLIMIFMMSIGIFIRVFKLASLTFIAYFYTGLGLALFLSGIIFIINFIKYKEK